MSRSNANKTREFQKKMRTQGAAGFAAGPWKDVEESLGMDQSVVVDQDGNPVWSVQHTRKPRHTVSRSGFDRLLGGVAVLALATLLTSVLAIYYEQTREPGDGVLVAGSGTSTDTDAGNTITLLRPPAAGYIDRPAVEVVENSASDRDIMQGTLDTATAPATGDGQPGMAETGHQQILTTAQPVTTAETNLVTDPEAATDLRDTTTAIAARDEASASLSESRALDSTAAAPVDTLSALGPDPVQGIEAITQQEPPAASAGPTASTGMTDESPAETSPDNAPATPGQPAAADETLAVIEPPADTDITDSASTPVGAQTPADMPAMADAGTAVTSPAMESPGPEEPASPDLAVADRLTVAPQADPVPQTGAVSPADIQTTGTNRLAQLEPAAPAASPAGAVATELEETAAVTMDDVPLPGATGRWIINLASYAGPKTASRMQQKFGALGVTTERQVAEVNGKTMYRLRIAAFESRGDAQAYFDSIKDTLGLESAWITKK
jgi:hypothetical protein